MKEEFEARIADLERLDKEKDDQIKKDKFAYIKEKAMLEQKESNYNMQIQDLKEQLEQNKRVQENAMLA